MANEEDTSTETTTTETTTEKPAEKEVTLDDVYRDAGLDKVTAQPAPQPEPQPAPQPQPRTEPSSVPDPLDSENFKAFMARQAAGTTEMQKAVGEIARYLNDKQRTEAVAATKADIDKAVSMVNEVVGHPKPKVIEATLDGMVRDDPRLKAIWENRGKNPAAWNSALKIVTKQIAEDFSAKVDPALVAAQRARKDSQKQMATTAPESDQSPVEKRLANKQGAEFGLEWENLISGGH